MARSISDRKRREWQRRLRRFHKSRQSIAAFCRQEGVSPPLFYFWRKRLAPAARAEGLGDVPRPASGYPGFRPVRIVPAAGVSVQLPGGTQVLVPSGDAESLRLVIETLARADAQRGGDIRPC
jgi:transposase-like protein